MFKILFKSFQYVSTVSKLYMKLQGKTSRIYKGKEYLKQWVVIPNSILEKLKWEKGEELKAKIKDGKLVIDKKD